MKTVIYFLFIVGLCVATITLAQSVPAHSNVDETDRQVAVRIADVMKTLEFNYFATEKLVRYPEKNKVELNERLQQMQNNITKILEMNKNKNLRASLKNLKQQLNGLEVATDKNDSVAMRQSLGQMYFTCFQCHQTHRQY